MFNNKKEVCVVFKRFGDQEMLVGVYDNEKKIPRIISGRDTKDTRKIRGKIFDTNCINCSDKFEIVTFLDDNGLIFDLDEKDEIYRNNYYRFISMIEACSFDDITYFTYYRVKMNEEQ